MNKINKSSIVTALIIISFVFGLVGPSTTRAAGTPPLGAASTFSALGATSVTNTGATTLSGDVGVSPGTSITGTSTLTVGGVTHNNDAIAIQAHADIGSTPTETHGNIMGQGATASIGPALDALTLTPGVYDIGAGRLNGGQLHLSGQGVYIFRASSDFVSSGSVSLESGARACDVFWDVQTIATINGTSFVGTIIAGTSGAGGVHFGSGVSLNGRALALGGDVAMIADNISGPSCAYPSGSVGGSLAAPQPFINVVKVPSPLFLLSPGLITYNYSVSNVGIVPMSNIKVTDNKCSPVNYISGDTNGDSNLDLNEIWTYTCTTNLSQTTLNTVTATGEANGDVAIKTANATVIVGAAIVPPLIHIVKTPNVFVLPAGGGAVTYTYKVTNPGTAPLSDVSITDNKCTGLPGRVIGHPGDLNNNNLLDPNETWTFTCQTNITQTTTNIGTAVGHANGLTAIDSAPATVVVSPPKLPNTGLPPEGTNTPWNIVALAGILVVGFASAVVLKKRTIS